MEKMEEKIEFTNIPRMKPRTKIIKSVTCSNKEKRNAHKFGNPVGQ